MKRYSLALFAVLALGLIGLSPSKAQAAVTCTQVAASGGFPKQSSFYCGSTTLAQGQTMASAVPVSAVNATNELRRSGVKYYLFDTPAEYQTYATANGLIYVAPASTDFGVTQFDGQNRPVYSAIFMQNSAGTTNTHEAYTTGLQVAAGLDYLIGFMEKSGVQGPVNLKFSDSADYQAAVNADWTAFNALQTCKVTNNGVFSTWADSTSTDCRRRSESATIRRA